MYKLCKTEKSLKRRIMIEEYLLAQMKQKGYEQIHVSDICRHFNMSRTVFYRFFDTKLDILDAYLDRMVQSYENFNHPDVLSPDALNAGTRHFIQYWYANREVIGILVKQNMADRLTQKVLSIAYMNNRVLQMITMDDSDAAMHSSVIFSAYGILGIMYDWQKRGFKETEDELIETLKNLLLKPLYEPEKLQMT